MMACFPSPEENVTIQGGRNDGNDERRKEGIYGWSGRQLEQLDHRADFEPAISVVPPFHRSVLYSRLSRSPPANYLPLPNGT